MKTARMHVLSLVGAVAALLITGCPNSPANSPPTASFWDFEVTGAGTAEVNGGYNLNGTYPAINPQRKYTKTDDSYDLFAFVLDADGLRHWAIDDVLIDYVVDPSTTLVYYNTTMGNQPAPQTNGWTTGTGGGSAPTVSRWAITGTTATTGNPLTAQYHFSDPDGDGEGTSLYQWYRFNTETETNPSLGVALGTSITYMTVAGDATKYLRFQVTPVDDQGNAGDPVLSGPSFQIGGGS